MSSMSFFPSLRSRGSNAAGCSPGSRRIQKTPVPRQGKYRVRRRVIKGDVERGFAEADYVVEDRFTTQPVDQAPMEREAYISCRLSPARSPSGQRPKPPIGSGSSLVEGAEAASTSNSRYRHAVGGGFGGCFCVRLLYICAALSRKVGRGIPVKMVNTREEEMVCSTIRHPTIWHLKTGVRGMGRSPR